MAQTALRISVPDDTWVQTLTDLGDRVEIVVWDTETPQPEGHLDVVLRPYSLATDVLSTFDTSRIGLVQSQSLGFDGVADTLPAGGFDAEIVRVASTSRDDEHGHVHATSDLPDLLPTVNVARGKVVDTSAIVRAAGRIRFATDVLDPEPLPADHPLWQAPGVLISPHVGGRSSAMRPRVERVVRHQIDRLLAGREPDHVVVRT